MFLNALPASDFGLFSFVMVAVSFAMSANGALITMPLTTAEATPALRSICFQANGPLCAGAGVLLFSALLLAGAGPGVAALMALYGAVFTFRWFARCLAYVEGGIAVSMLSDLAYGAVLIAALGALKLSGRLDFTNGALAMLAAALLALLPYGRAFFRTQISALGRHLLSDYAGVFRTYTRWSLTGVALTEVTVNAHAYLVTFIAGPGAFALLALGLLLMRPASLVQTALPDLERPVMARAIQNRDRRALGRTVREFAAGLSAAWLANVLLCAALIALAPEMLVKKGYALPDVTLVAAIAAVIMAARALRTAPAVLLQAAGEFRALARVGVESAVVSVAATLILLLAWGPVASLCGILMGDLVILARTLYLVRRWRGSHAC
jgi:hypothetical protein